jgi:hypothetical protein
MIKPQCQRISIGGVPQRLNTVPKVLAQKYDGPSLPWYDVDDFILEIKTQTSTFVLWHVFIEWRVQVCNKRHLAKSLIIFQDLFVFESINVFSIAVIGLGFVARINGHLNRSIC